MRLSLTVADLKELLHHNHGRLDKLLVVLASFEEPCQIAQVKQRAREAGFRIPPKWNVSGVLSRSHGRAIRTPEGWEITDAGLQHLAGIGAIRGTYRKSRVAGDLRDTLGNIQDVHTRSFVEEAVSCYEAGYYRSAIIMSWVGAVGVLHNAIHGQHLAAFNREARRRDRRWKPAKNTDDLGRMREAEFLDIICALSIIGHSVKTELKSCLSRRNACGHPSSLEVAANTAAHHLEVLVLNVFTRH